MEKIKIHDKHFTKFIEYTSIVNRTTEIAQLINKEYKDKNPLFIVVLNGAFLFASELLKKVEGDTEIIFCRVSSYDGINSTGTIKSFIGFEEIQEGRDIIVIEDIVDTGLTVEYLYQEIRKKNPSSLKIATLLIKPEAYKKIIPIDYIGFSIPNAFVVGFGLDYNERGRNLTHIYQLSQ